MKWSILNFRTYDLKRRFVPALIAAAVLFQVSPVFAQGYQVGDKAADFKLPNIDGRKISLADYKNAKGFIVVFTCNHCPYAVKNEDRLIELDKKYAPQGYPVIAINPSDSSEFPTNTFVSMQQRANEKSFTFPYLVDGTQEVAKSFGATKTPHLYVLQKKGSDLVVKYIGAIDDSPDDASGVKTKYVEAAVDALLQGKSVATNSTKAIGCGIKYRGE